MKALHYVKRHWAVLIALAFLAQAAGAQSAREWIQQGNTACAEGNFNEALDAYEAASVENPESPWVYYNKGVAFFGLEQYEEAREAFEAAAIKSDDLTMEARAQYNLGHCSFREAERQRDSDLQKTVESIEQSIRHYQDALKLDPEMSDAAKNIEVARITLKAILDEIKKQQEQQQQNQELMKKLEALIQRQSQCNAKTATAAQTGDDAAQAPALEKQQGAIRGDTQALNQELGQQIAAQQQAMQQAAQQQAAQQPGGQAPAAAPHQGMQSPLTAVAQDIDHAVASQGEAEGALSQPSLSAAQPPQKEALEALKAAKEKLQGDQEQQQQQQQQQQNQDQQQQQGQDQQEEQQAQQGEEEQQEEQQQEEGDQSQEEQEEAQEQAAMVEDARDILDEEEENKEKRQVMPQGGYRAVDKDW